MKKSGSKKTTRKKRSYPIIFVPEDEKLQLIREIIFKLYLLDKLTKKDYNKTINLK